MTGILCKLNSNTTNDSPENWKPRFFVLCDTNLYLFRCNASPTSLPMSFLPLSHCLGMLDTTLGCPMLQLHGTGVSRDTGELVQRVWTLRCPSGSEEVFSVWLKAIQGVLMNRERGVNSGNGLRSRSVSLTSRSRSNSFGRGVSRVSSVSSMRSVAGGQVNGSGSSSQRLSDLMHSLSSMDFMSPSSETPDTARSSVGSDPTESHNAHASSSFGFPAEQSVCESPLTSFLDAPLTLESIQEGNQCISAFLHKLNGHTTTPTDWKRRFFVFDKSTAHLHLFKTNTNPRSVPVTFLPVTSCSGFMDTLDGNPMIQVKGSGVSRDGEVVQRVWTLRCENEEEFSVWIRTIRYTLMERSERGMVEEDPVERNGRSRRSSSYRRVSASPDTNPAKEPCVTYQRSISNLTRSSSLRNGRPQPARGPSREEPLPVVGKKQSLGSNLSSSAIKFFKL
ncbi:hypothetical protein HDU98_012359 [Podochytrium sp. JEL0797]|nr:hypothetical protein HDU98_012359 [Podochytrium sp. JEL0797]